MVELCVRVRVWVYVYPPPQQQQKKVGLGKGNMGKESLVQLHHKCFTTAWILICQRLTCKINTHENELVVGERNNFRSRAEN